MAKQHGRKTAHVTLREAMALHRAEARLLQEIQTGEWNGISETVRALLTRMLDRKRQLIDRDAGVEPASR